MEHLSISEPSGDWSQLYFDLAPVIFLVLGVDFEVRRINEKGATVLELPKDEIVGKLWFEHFVPVRFREAERAQFNRLSTSDEEDTIRIESCVVTSSGFERMILWNIQAIRDEGGLPLAFVCAGEDVTKRREAEKALRETEAKARAILETTVDAVITIDERGIIETFNSAAERIFRYQAEEVIGRNVKVLMPPPYREEHDGYMRSYRETGRRKIIGIGREVVGLRKDGTTFPMDLAVSEVKLEGRTIFTGIIRDISDRRRLEHEILRTSDLERRRIGQDLHDGLGQMLTGTALIARNLAKKLRADGRPEAEDLEEITGFIQEADNYARGLAKGLVPVELEENGLAAALRQLAVNAQRLFDVRCTFEQIGSAANVDSTAATHVYRIAQEAVSNAVKHGRADKILITLSGGKRQLRLRVKDDGVGFPEDLPEDRGMGVQIMNYRARVIGGTLEIWRDPAGGTTVTCTLPYQAAVSSSLATNEKLQ